MNIGNDNPVGGVSEDIFRVIAEENIGFGSPPFNNLAIELDIIHLCNWVFKVMPRQLILSDGVGNDLAQAAGKILADNLIAHLIPGPGKLHNHFPLRHGGGDCLQNHDKAIATGNGKDHAYFRTGANMQMRPNLLGYFGNGYIVVLGPGHHRFCHTQYIAVIKQRILVASLYNLDNHSQQIGTRNDYTHLQSESCRANIGRQFSHNLHLNLCIENRKLLYHIHTAFSISYSE